MLMRKRFFRKNRKNRRATAVLPGRNLKQDSGALCVPEKNVKASGPNRTPAQNAEDPFPLPFPRQQAHNDAVNRCEEKAVNTRPRFHRFLLLLAAMLALAPPPAAGAPGPPQKGDSAMTLTLESITFKDKGNIPAACTCDGTDTSPGLHWSEAPEGTKSYALIVDDPDAPDPAAPKMTYVHWVLFNIPPNVTSLPEGVKVLPGGIREGLNDWGRTGYGGPCPPIGTHRYFHKLYALDTMLDIPGTPTKPQLLKGMEGHVLAQAALMGTYAREKK